MRMSDSISVPANSQVANVLAGLIGEFPSGDTPVSVYVAAAATGVRASFIVGKQSVLNDQLCSFSNRFPVIPDDRTQRIGVRAGRRLILTFRNTTAGAIIANWIVDLEAL